MAQRHTLTLPFRTLLTTPSKASKPSSSLLQQTSQSRHLHSRRPLPQCQFQRQSLRQRQPQLSRSLSTTPPNQARYKTVEQAKSAYRVGPFSIYSGLFFLICGVGVYYYFQSEKDRIGRKRVREASKGVGKPRIGGAFELVDQDGRRFTDRELKGKFALIYFGFTHCPDICPDELDKMAKMIDLVKAKRGNVLTPVFITCDPNRDSPEIVKSYLSEFHGDLIGLTGTWEQVKATCKAFRVYFSTPPHVQPGQDYLVDHSIYFYLLDPEGDFIEVIGRQHTATQGSKIIADHIDTRMGRTVSPESWREDVPTDLRRILPKSLGVKGEGYQKVV